ncbi:MAG: CHASE4 domain-containing protein [Phormidesmis sp.]
MRKYLARSQHLSTKVLSTVSAVFCILFVGQYSLARYIIIRSYAELEHKQVLTNAERLQQITRQEIDDLAGSTQDWAWWTETYEYAQGSNADYKEENLVNANTYDSLALDFLVVFDTRNRPVFAGTVDSQSRQVVDLAPDFTDKLARCADRIDSGALTSDLSGLIIHGQQPALLSIRHILKNNKTGPAQGTLVMGRFIDQSKLADFSETTRLPVEAFLYSAKNLSADTQIAKTRLMQSGETVITRVLSEEKVAGYSLVFDLEGRPGLLLKASMERDVYAEGQTSLKYYLWSTGFMGLTVCGLTLLLLRRLVLSRLESLNTQVGEIGSLTQGDRQIELPGKDELSSLAETINQTIEQLKQRTDELAIAKQVADEAREIADRANHAKSSFLASMSHELRTPLNAILGFAQVLGRESGLTNYQYEKLNIINRSGEHLLSLINDVLDMSKIESGRIELTPNSFDLYHLLEMLADMLQLKAQAKGISLVVKREKNLPRYIYSDERKLRQVLLNLLSNAVKFTEVGSVTLAAGPATDSSLAASLSATKRQRLAFSVTDTGTGIASEEIDPIFQPFVQTEAGRQAQEGTGLGLSISRKFVELMGGKLSATSEVGKGSTFSFDITVELASATDSRLSALSPQVIGLEPGQPAYRILVVDDRELNRQLVRELLVPVGFEVQEAEDGQQAIETWEIWEPHLIWMDMQMPVLNGYEATRQIKASVRGQATVVIALTASTQEEERAIVLAAGCNDFMRKPFRQEKLFAKMAEHLGVRYVYAEAVLDKEPLPAAGSVDLAAINTAMLAMPIAWNQQLQQAAAQLKDKEIFALLTKVPEEYGYLQQAIAAKVNNFDFDQIEELAGRVSRQTTAV